MLRIGFVGTGVIAWAHALCLQSMIEGRLIDAALSEAYDIHADRASRFAAVTGASVAGSVADVVARCDAVYVCTPTASHSAAVETAANHGRAVFCEKPLATDLAGAEQLAAIVDDAGVPAQVGLVLRSTPIFRALRDIVSAEELGRPMAVAFRDDQYFPTQGIYGSTWRADVDVAGGGCLIEHSIHDLDILRFCFGEVADLSARTANVAGHPGIEDVASVALRFESGVTADLVSVWHSILSRPSTRRVEVFCEQGLAWLDHDFLGPLHVQTSAGEEARPCPSPPWADELNLSTDEVGLAIRMYLEADRAFVDAVTDGRPPTPTFADAVVAHRLVDAAYRSAAAPVRSLPGV